MYLQSTIEAINSAKQPILQLSGGRDSLCALLLLEEAGCNNFDIVWLDTGDVPKETAELMQDFTIRYDIRFHVIRSDSHRSRHNFGIPSPVVRSKESSPLFKQCASDAVHVQPNFECCYRVMMQPMHEFLVRNGFDLVIRGTRANECLKAPINHLETCDYGYKVAFPIFDWSTEEVNTFLTERRMLPGFYRYMGKSIECLTCPGFWDYGHQAYLEALYPTEAESRRNQINELLIYISGAVSPGMTEAKL